MKIENIEEISFAISVYGYAPEFWPALAFRQANKRFGKGGDRQKEIKCPYCGKLLLTVSVSRRLDLIRFGKRGRINCHEYRSCHRCHEKVGIIYLAG